MEGGREKSQTKRTLGGLLVLAPGLPRNQYFHFSLLLVASGSQPPASGVEGTRGRARETPQGGQTEEEEEKGG